MVKPNLLRNLILLVSLAVSLSSIAQSPEPARQDALIHLVKQDCGSCHGMTLKGGLGPALTSEELKNKPDQYLIDTILYGREQLAMPPWKGILTEQEVHWIVKQLKTEIE